MRYSANQKSETRAAILKPAGTLFKELGFQAGSVDKVIEAAGLIAGGFYADFPSKEDLFVESLRKSLGALSLARAVDSEVLADEILVDCFRFVHEALGPELQESEESQND